MAKFWIQNSTPSLFPLPLNIHVWNGRREGRIDNEREKIIFFIFGMREKNEEGKESDVYFPPYLISPIWKENRKI